MAHFDRAEYAEAARGFLQADALAPNGDALRNAITAGQRASEYLLVVEAAERGLKRDDGDLATVSRDALADAARNLSRVDLSCQASPCTLSFDGAPAEPAKRYVLPGTHVAVAVTPDGARAEEHVVLNAGAAYSIVLHPSAPGEHAAPAGAVATAPRATPDVSTERGARTPEPAPDRPHKPLPPAVFYAGAGVSAVLIGLNVWSGLDALSAKSDLPKHGATQTQEDDVRAKEHRSDAIFASAVVVSALTITSAFLWVDWGGDGSRDAAVTALPGGAFATARGRF